MNERNGDWTMDRRGVVEPMKCAIASWYWTEIIALWRECALFSPGIALTSYATHIVQCSGYERDVAGRNAITLAKFAFFYIFYEAFLH